jgi:transcription antitermination factor NusG
MDLDVGKRNRIIAAPFIGIEGLFSRVNGTSRVIVSIAAIEQSFSVQIPQIS